MTGEICAAAKSSGVWSAGEAQYSHLPPARLSMMRLVSMLTKLLNRHRVKAKLLCEYVQRHLAKLGKLD